MISTLVAGTRSLNNFASIWMILHLTFRFFWLYRRCFKWYFKSFAFCIGNRTFTDRYSDNRTFLSDAKERGSCFSVGYLSTEKQLFFIFSVHRMFIHVLSATISFCCVPKRKVVWNQPISDHSESLSTRFPNRSPVSHGRLLSGLISHETTVIF